MSVNTNIIKELSQQYLATLKMIEDVIMKTKDDQWQDFSYSTVISQLVYHILSATDYYVSKINDERSLFPRKYGNSGPPFNNPDRSFTKQQLQDYLKEVKEKADKIFTNFTFEELSNGELYDLQGGTFSIFGSLIYNLRYSMHHIGKIHARLSSLGNESLPWVIRIYDDERDKFLEMDHQAVIYLKQRKLDEAENIYLELTAKSEEPVYFYNLACIYSLKKKPEKAFNSLKMCFLLDKHYIFKDFAKNDNDFTNIREIPAFKRLIQPQY